MRKCPLLSRKCLFLIRYATLTNILLRLVVFLKISINAVLRNGNIIPTVLVNVCNVAGSY